jgi:hypothetical protein
VFISTFQKKNKSKKFKHIIPTYLHYLREMFHSVTVDGRSSCIHGKASSSVDAYRDEYTEAAGDDHVGTLNSRAHKKIKNPMVKAIKGLIETLKEGNDLDKDTFVTPRVTKSLIDFISLLIKPESNG